MERIKIDTNNPIETDEEWLLLVEQTFNDRTILCYYNPNKKSFQICIFNLLERPNALAQNSKESRWGWITYFVDSMKTEAETEEVVNLYMNDLRSENCWWEKL